MVKSSTSRKDLEQAQRFAIEAARLLLDRHCEDIRILDVHGLSQVCDFVLIGSGTSDRQMKSLASELEDLAVEHGEKVYRTNRDTGVTWIVIDFIDVVVHLFEPNQRSYYDLEELWSDAAVIAWERSGAEPSTAVAKTMPVEPEGDS